MADLMADTLLYIGLTHYLATLPTAPELTLDFELAQANFYRAAQVGLGTNVTWIDGVHYELVALMKQQILPRVLESLASLKINPIAIEQCADILMGRVETRQNGATWQRRKFAEANGHPQRVLLDYVRHQATGLPVHTWA